MLERDWYGISRLTNKRENNYTGKKRGGGKKNKTHRISPLKMLDLLYKCTAKRHKSEPAVLEIYFTTWASQDLHDRDGATTLSMSERGPVSSQETQRKKSKVFKH